MRTTPSGTVRAATLDALRSVGLTTIFANPGSTEVSFLAGLPDDFRFVLALHEGSVVGVATGWALARGEPALVNLHTTAGLGNAVGALATARVNRAPLVVLVGQQDRRHLALEPFLAGRLDGLAGDYPVWVGRPQRAADVPAAVVRARHEAVTGRGPAIVIVPMDDWQAPMPEGEPYAAPAAVRLAPRVDDAAVAEVAALVDAAGSVAVVAGAGADTADGRAALVALAERLGAPVWQEAFGARAGFPGDHPLYAGQLPAGRGRLRDALAGHDLVLVVGAPVFRQYPYEPGSYVTEGTTVVQVTDDPGEAHHGPADLAVVADIAPTCRALAERVRPRDGASGTGPGRPAPGRTEPAEATALDLPSGGSPLRAAHVYQALAARISPDTVVVEESPSSRPDLERLLPARRPMGFLSAAMGGLGFGLPAAVGVRMATPRRPVVALLGDGSSLYAVQGLWTAAHYNVGVLFVVLANGAYAIMDRLAERHGQKAPWPWFPEVSLHRIAEGFGCPTLQISTSGELTAALDDVAPRLEALEHPLLLDVAVQADPHFNP